MDVLRKAVLPTVGQKLHKSMAKPAKELKW